MLNDILEIYKLDYARYSLISCGILSVFHAVMFIVLRSKSDSLGPFAMFYLNQAICMLFLGYFEFRTPTDGGIFWAAAALIVSVTAILGFIASGAIFFFEGRMKEKWTENQWVADVAGIEFIYRHKVILGIVALVLALLIVISSDR